MPWSLPEGAGTTRPRPGRRRGGSSSRPRGHSSSQLRSSNSNNISSIADLSPVANVISTYRPPQYPPRMSRGTGRGGPPQPGPHRPQQGASHPAPRPAGVPGGRGRGRGRHQRPRLAYHAGQRRRSTLVVVDEERPESTQQVDGEETGAFQGQSLEN